jgi:hypothetical protein
MLTTTSFILGDGEEVGVIVWSLCRRLEIQTSPPHHLTSSPKSQVQIADPTPLTRKVFYRMFHAFQTLQELYTVPWKRFYISMYWPIPILLYIRKQELLTKYDILIV